MFDSRTLDLSWMWQSLVGVYRGGDSEVSVAPSFHSSCYSGSKTGLCVSHDCAFSEEYRAKCTFNILFKQ